MIEIINQTKFVINQRRIKKISQQLFDHFQIPQNHILEILFLSEKNIKSLNQSYRSQPKPTDVLSFPLPIISKLTKPQIFGSIVICPQYISKYSPENSDNYLPYIIHGFLHLTGLDHETDEQYHNFQQITHLISTKLQVKEIF